MNHDYFQEIKRELLEIKDRYPTISEDNAFVVWFLKAFVTDNEQEAYNSIGGMANDKGCDAVFIDHNNRMVFVIQGKYHQGETNVKLSDVVALAELGRTILSERTESFESLLHKANPSVKQLLSDARNQIQKNNYQLILNFVTTGKISSVHAKQAEDNIEEFENARFQTYGREDLLKLMQDYLEGAAPPVPTVSLPVTGGEVFNRVDAQTGITSWIFTMKGADVAELFNSMGVRLFARNIRGYLGSSDVNRGMQFTIENEPEYFWYYNNGITIICDKAKQIRDGYANKIRINSAQIINGQQTTRTLSQLTKNDAEVLVKLIELPRSKDASKFDYNRLIGEIVSATNFQNYITQADLKSNDIEQVRIEKQFKKYNYFYIRKKMTKSESVKYGSDKYPFKIKKEELARAVAATAIDPYEVRSGVDRLFEEDVYSKVFNGRNPAEYLAIYWLFREIKYWSAGNEIYVSSKWWVLHLLWKVISQDMKKSIIKNNLRIVCERPGKYSTEYAALSSLVKKIFALSKIFYQKNKRNYGKIQVPRDFFKHVNLHKDFYTLYKSLDERSKVNIDNSCQRLVSVLSDME